MSNGKTDGTELADKIEALALMLKVAILAPTQAETDVSVAAAGHLAASMSDSDVEAAKRAAKAAVEYERQCK